MNRTGDTLASGHYITYIKHGEQWYEYNDSWVRTVDPLQSVDGFKWVGLYEPDNQP